jgi:hypothetical protein
MSVFLWNNAQNLKKKGKENDKFQYLGTELTHQGLTLKSIKVSLWIQIFIFTF